MKRMTFCLLMLLSAVCLQAQTVNTPPSEATIETDWVCSFVMHSSGGDETVSEAMQVAFDGADVYFNLPNPIAGNTWVKGTVSEGSATFEKGQYLGNYSGSVYMVGQNEAGICDLVFGYNAEKGVFSLDNMQLVLSASATTIDGWAYYTDMTVVKGGQVAEGTWNIAYTMHYYDNNNQEQTQSDTEPVEVTIDGTEVAINFPNPLNGAAWIKGTISGTQAVFAQGQEMGTYGGSPFYLAGLNEAGLCDVVFNYDAEAKTFTLGDMYLLINGSATQSAPWCYFSQATITQGTVVVEEDEETVTLPEGLTPAEYVFSGRDIIYAQDGSIDHMDAFARMVKIAFSGADVYVQGFCDFLPAAWVKGSKVDDELVFAKNQFMGKMLGYSVYLTGKSYGELTDVTFRENGDTWQGGYVILNSSKTTEAPFAVYAGTQLKKFVEVAATPATPAIRDYQPYSAEEGYAVLFLDVPAADVAGNPITTRKLGWTVYTEKDGQQTQYVFTADKYKNLPEASMTVIPYEFTDDYDFPAAGGTTVFINDNFDGYDRIGLQSIYTGAGETRQSEIAWFDLQSQGIRTASSNTVVSETYTDLQGRKVSPSVRGLVIKTQRLADGSMKTVKVMK